MWLRGWTSSILLGIPMYPSECLIDVDSEFCVSWYRKVARLLTAIFLPSMAKRNATHVHSP